MTALKLLDDREAATRCPLDGRQSHETLHEYLLRRHSEMSDELFALRAQVSWQDQHLDVHRQAADRGQLWLIVSLAIDATLALLVFLAGILNSVPVSVAVVTLAILVGGSLFAVCMPHFDPVLADLRDRTC